MDALLKITWEYLDSLNTHWIAEVCSRPMGHPQSATNLTYHRAYNILSQHLREYKETMDVVLLWNGFRSADVNEYADEYRSPDMAPAWPLSGVGETGATLLARYGGYTLELFICIGRRAGYGRQHEDWDDESDDRLYVNSMVLRGSEAAPPTLDPALVARGDFDSMYGGWRLDSWHALLNMRLFDSVVNRAGAYMEHIPNDMYNDPAYCEAAMALVGAFNAAGDSLFHAPLYMHKDFSSRGTLLFTKLQGAGWA